MSWREHAACAGEDTSLFFPWDGERGHAAERREAKAKEICSGCTVRPECLAWAEDHRERGLWGGLTEDERASERKNGRRRSQRRGERVA